MIHTSTTILTVVFITKKTAAQKVLRLHVVLFSPWFPVTSESSEEWSFYLSILISIISVIFRNLVSLSFNESYRDDYIGQQETHTFIANRFVLCIRILSLSSNIISDIFLLLCLCCVSFLPLSLLPSVSWFTPQSILLRLVSVALPVSQLRSMSGTRESREWPLFALRTKQVTSWPSWSSSSASKWSSCLWWQRKRYCLLFFHSCYFYFGTGFSYRKMIHKRLFFPSFYSTMTLLLFCSVSSSLHPSLVSWLFKLLV